MKKQVCTWILTGLLCTGCASSETLQPIETTQTTAQEETVLLDRQEELGDIVYYVNSEWVKSLSGDYTVFYKGDTDFLMVGQAELNTSLSNIGLDLLLGEDTFQETSRERKTISGIGDTYFVKGTLASDDTELVVDFALFTIGESTDHDLYLFSLVNDEEDQMDLMKKIILNVKVVEDTSVPQETIAPTTVPEEVKEPVSTVTTGQRNALSSANSYLRYMNFSYAGLVDQLEYEGYTEEEARYAVDNCGADWNVQAVGSAKDYLKYTAFSYSGLVDQLVYEQFTYDQAVYGVDHCGADWYEQAVKCAQSYLSFMSFSRSELIDQLVYEGFTYEQAEYGVSQNGY